MSRLRKPPPPRPVEPKENPAAEELARLRGCLRDLVALAGLSAAWQGSTPRQIAERLAEVLQHTLTLEFSYVRLQAGGEAVRLEAACTAQGLASPEETGRIAAALAPWVEVQPPGHNTVTELADPVGTGQVRAVRLPVGHDGALGVVVAAARHPGFPSDAECALLQTGLNQAVLVLQRLGTLPDGQDRKQAEETAARLAAIIESSEDAIISKSLEGVITTWNAAAARLFGYPAAEAIGQSITLIIPPAHQAEEQTILRRLRQGERIEHLETVRRTKDGRLLDVSLSISPIRSAGGQIIGASTIARDISERKRTEERLRQSEARFRLLTEAVPSMVWTAAPDGTITYANQRWLQYVGLNLEQNAQSWPERVLHPDDYQRCLAEWKRALEQGSEYQIEVRNRRYDGVYRWFISRAVPLKDSAGQISAWVGATTDIHDQKELQEALQEASRQKDEFLAMLGHELRNPLGPMRNAVEILNRVDAQSEEARQARAMIDRQLGHLARLVDDLLDISRIARGKLLLRTQRLDFVRLVRQTAEDYRSILEATGIRLELDLPPEPLWVDGDSTRLAQIVGNLLHNAHKFTNPGGRVVVRVYADGDQATVSVRDTGIGIDAELLGCLFKVFSQAQQDLSRSRGGLGLGLALVKGFAELHGGRVEAASAGPGQGAQFTIRLPLSSAPFMVPAALPQPEGGVGYRVLVIEDNRDAADSLAMLLNLTGYQVRTAYTGEAGLSAAREFQPQAVICDIGLPDIDGYEVARRLRADPVLGRVPLVALTGYGRDEDQRQTLEAGFDLHLTKPVDLATLRQAVVKLKALASRVPPGSQYC